MNQALLSNKGLGFLFAIISAIFWGTNGTFCSILGQFGLSSVNIAILAPMFNFLFFFLIVLITNRNSFKINLKYLVLLVIDGFFSASVNYSYVKSVSYFPVGIVSTLVFCNIFTIMILSRIVFGYKFTARKVLSGVVALFGVGMVLNIFSQGFNINGYGVLWILSTIISWSLMITIEKYLIDQGNDGNVILMYMGLFAVLFLAFLSPPWSLMTNIKQVVSIGGNNVLFAIFGYGIIPQIGCYIFYFKALKNLEPCFIQLAFSLDPVTASILGYTIFSQKMSPIQIMGIFVILFTVIYIQVLENKEGKVDQDMKMIGG